MARANRVTITPRTPASEFLTTVNRLQNSLMIRDPYAAKAFRAAEDDGLAPGMVETGHPKHLLEEVRSAAAIASNSRLAEEHAAQWREPLAFAVTHLRGMTRALRKKHYSDEAA